MLPCAQRLPIDIDEFTQRLPICVHVQIGSESVVAAVSSALFGSEGAPDDANAGFFEGAAQADYYDPQNSFLDCVLDRREGIPISLSIIAADACEQLGCPMVGLNAPGHLLLTPADGSPLVLDCFNAGRMMSEEEAATFIGLRTPSQWPADDGQAQTLGLATLTSLRTSPMTTYARRALVPTAGWDDLPRGSPGSVCFSTHAVSCGAHECCATCEASILNLETWYARDDLEFCQHTHMSDDCTCTSLVPPARCGCLVCVIGCVKSQSIPDWQ